MEEVVEKTPVLEPTNISLLFANGSIVARSLTELQISFTMNGKPQCLIVVPFPVGKSLIESLTNAIGDQERKSGQAVLDLKELYTKENAK